MPYRPPIPISSHLAPFAAPATPSLFPSPGLPSISLFCFSYLCLFQHLPGSLAPTPVRLSSSLLPPLKVQMLHVKSPGWAPTVRSPPVRTPSSQRDLWPQLCILCISPPALGQVFSLPGDYLGALAFPPAPTLYPAGRGEHREKREGTALGTRCKDMEPLPLHPPFVPSGRCTSGKIPA